MLAIYYRNHQKAMIVIKLSKIRRTYNRVINKKNKNNMSLRFNRCSPK